MNKKKCTLISMDVKLDMITKRIEDLSINIINVQNSLNNHLEHHKFLEQMNSLKREWIRWIIPIVITIGIFITNYFIIRGGG